MSLLIAGLAVFFAGHVVPMVPDLRAKLVDALGRPVYGLLFSLESLLGLGLIIWGYRTAETSDVYIPFDGARHLTLALLLIAFIFLVSYGLKGYIRKIFRKPASMAIGLWATGHLLANGDSVSVVLFGSFLVYALVDLAWVAGTQAGSDFTPQIGHDLAAGLAGALLYGAMLFAHPYLFAIHVI